MKNATSNFEHVLEATSYKAAAIQPLISHHENYQRQIRHAGHCWRSRDELISDLLLWTPSHGRAKAGWPVWTYIHQLSEDTGCIPEDLPEVMNDREEWRERVSDICAGSTTRWWWWRLFSASKGQAFSSVCFYLSGYRFWYLMLRSSKTLRAGKSTENSILLSRKKIVTC